MTPSTCKHAGLGPSWMSNRNSLRTMLVRYCADSRVDSHSAAFGEGSSCLVPVCQMPVLSVLCSSMSNHSKTVETTSSARYT